MKKTQKICRTAAIIIATTIILSLMPSISKNLNPQTVNASETVTQSQALTASSQEKTDLDDGIYTIEAELGGGSGRASLNSAQIAVIDGAAMAMLEWSSSNYDYMIVNGAKYFPINDTGNSKFLIPVYAFDREFAVIADTVAMSVPHEIEYTITFKTDTAKRIESGIFTPTQIIMLAAVIIVAVIAVALAILFIKRASKNN